MHCGGYLGICIVLAHNLSLMQLHIYNVIAMLSYLTGGCMARYIKSLWESEGQRSVNHTEKNKWRTAWNFQMAEKYKILVLLLLSALQK